MCKRFPLYTRVSGPPPKKAYFFGPGITLECCQISADAYLSTIIAPASLFKGIPQDKISIRVYGSTGVLYKKAKLLACDFHYNLALLTVNSNSPLPTAVLTPIDDVLSIDPNDHHPNIIDTNNKRKKVSFGLRPHSCLFKVAPDTHLVSVSRSYDEPLALIHGSGTLCLRDPIPKNKNRLRDPVSENKNYVRGPILNIKKRLSDHEGCSCNELYEIKKTDFLGIEGAPVLNSIGQIIGIVFDNSLFLPSNVVLRWWNRYKSSGGFCRPFLGMEVFILHEADFDFLAQFTTSFPDLSTAVVVTKVEEDSPASRSGICVNDVIVKLEGKLVRSKLEFYETIWEKVGKAVEVNILRVAVGKDLNVSLVVEEASPNQFYQYVLLFILCFFFLFVCFALPEWQNLTCDACTK